MSVASNVLGDGSSDFDISNFNRQPKSWYVLKTYFLRNHISGLPVIAGQILKPRFFENWTIFGFFTKCHLWEHSMLLSCYWHYLFTLAKKSRLSIIFIENCLVFKKIVLLVFKSLKLGCHRSGLKYGSYGNVIDFFVQQKKIAYLSEMTI